MTKLRSGLKRLRAVLAAEPNSRELWERSRTRWRAAQPVNHLTWARDLNGDAFVSRMESYDVFNPTAEDRFGRTVQLWAMSAVVRQRLVVASHHPKGDATS